MGRAIAIEKPGAETIAPGFSVRRRIYFLRTGHPDDCRCNGRQRFWRGRPSDPHRGLVSGSAAAAAAGGALVDLIADEQAKPSDATGASTGPQLSIADVQGAPAEPAQKPAPSLPTDLANAV